MWSIGELKNNAWESVKRYYWMGLLVCFIVSAISGGIRGVASGFQSVTSGVSRSANSSSFSSNVDPGEAFDEYMEKIKEPFTGSSSIFYGVSVVAIIIIIFAITLIIWIISACWKAFIVNPLIAGKNRFFMLSRGFDDVGVGKIFCNFRNGKYLKTVKTLFLTDLFVWLWSLLLVIPGIYKHYQYFLVSYIVSENPNIDSKRARQLSAQMTDGEKFNIFVLQLSFIGWWILACVASICCCGVGMIFVAPYYESSMAELYTVLRTKAFANGLVTETELSGFDPAE